MVTAGYRHSPTVEGDVLSRAPPGLPSSWKRCLVENTHHTKRREYEPCDLPGAFKSTAAKLRFTTLTVLMFRA